MDGCLMRCCLTDERFKQGVLGHVQMTKEETVKGERGPGLQRTMISALGCGGFAVAFVTLC